MGEQKIGIINSKKKSRNIIESVIGRPKIKIGNKSTTIINIINVSATATPRITKRSRSASGIKKDRQGRDSKNADTKIYQK